MVLKSQRPVNPKRFPEINETFNIHSWHCLTALFFYIAVSSRSGWAAPGRPGRRAGAAQSGDLMEPPWKLTLLSVSRVCTIFITLLKRGPFRPEFGIFYASHSAEGKKRFIVVMMLSLSGAKLPCLCDDVFIFKYI